MVATSSEGAQINKYARICALNSPLVTIAFDPMSGQYFSSRRSDDLVAGTTATGGDRILTTLDHGGEGIVRAVGGNKIYLRGNNNARLLESNGLSSASNASKTHYARSCPCDSSGRTYCLIGGGAVPDACGIPWSDDAVTLLQQNKNISGIALYNTTGIGCFGLSSHTMFTRNAWPVVVLWYGALSIFLLFTSNGKFARNYIVHLVCPKVRVNEEHIERILSRENAIRYQFRLAEMQAADETGQSLLVSWRRGRVPNRDASGRERITDDEARREQAARWRIVQPGIEDIPPPQVEYVLMTKKFNAEKERARRDQIRHVRAESTASMNELSLKSTPKHIATSKLDASTPKSEITSNGSDDEQPSPADLNDLNASQNVCTVCPCDEDIYECTICLTEIEDGEQVGALPCTHIYHVDCLKQWLSRKNACPLCQVTEIASPRELVSGANHGNSSDASPNDGNAPGNQERRNSYREADAQLTRAIVESELSRSSQDRRRRRHRRRERFFETYQLGV